MRHHLRRVGVLLVAAVIGILSMVTPAHANGITNCADEGDYICDLQTYGYNSSGTRGQTGWAYTYLFFEGGTGIAPESRLALLDTWANGRGVKVQLNAHKFGTPENNDQANYINLGTYKDNGGGFQYLTSAYWHRGIDFVYLNYADTWSGCSYCYVGTWKILNPNKMPGS